MVVSVSWCNPPSVVSRLALVPQQTEGNPVYFMTYLHNHTSLHHWLHTVSINTPITSKYNYGRHIDLHTMYLLAVWPESNTGVFAIITAIINSHNHLLHISFEDLHVHWWCGQWPRHSDISWILITPRIQNCTINQHQSMFFFCSKLMAGV